METCLNNFIGYSRNGFSFLRKLINKMLAICLIFNSYQEPNPDDPLNKEAAEVLKTNVNTFRSNVGKTMQGGVLNGVHFDRVLIK